MTSIIDGRAQAAPMDTGKPLINTQARSIGVGECLYLECHTPDQIVINEAGAKIHSGRGLMHKEHMKTLSLTSFALRANLRAKLITLFFVGLLAFVTCAPDRFTHAQYCNPAMVSYIVRDENGEVLSAAALKSVCEQLPKSIGEARVYAGETSFANDRRTFYWTESVEWAKGEKVPSLHFSNNETCVMHFAEVTLTHQDKKMRLIFNIEITRAQPDRRPVIDSLPFQEGTFALDLNGWSHDTDKIIPSEKWNQVEDKAAAEHLKPCLSR